MPKRTVTVEEVNTLKDFALSAAGIIKAKFLKLATFLATFFGPVAFVFFLVGAMIVADTIAGRWAAKHKARSQGLNTREEVTSRKTRKGMLDKMWTYLGLVVVIFIFDYYMLNAFLMYLAKGFPIEYVTTKLLGFVLVLMELDSIDEKYYRVKGIRIFDKIKIMVKRMRSIIINTSETVQEIKNPKTKKIKDAEDEEAEG